MNHAQFWGGAAAAPYEIEQSLRVNKLDSANMTRTFNDGGSSHTQWTFSFWTKRHNNSPGDEVIFYTHKGSGYSRLDIGSGGGTGVSLLQWNGSSWDYGIFTQGKLRDPSAWYHMVFVYDSPNATSTERLRVYINGERQEINTTYNESYPSQNFASELGKDVQHWLFRGVNYGTSYYNGYAAETYFIDNQALDPTDFGELDDNGVWRPIEYTGTYGGNSFYLQYASSGIGNDSSGEGNNWTPSAGFTTSGTGTDVMSDTPTTNYCTLNPIGTTYGFQLPVDGNLKTDSNDYAYSTEGTFGIPKDGNLYYFEGTMTRIVGDGGTGLFFGCHTQGTTADPNSTSGKYFGPYGTDGRNYDGAIFLWQYSNYLGNAKFAHINAGTVLAHAIKYDSGTWKYWFRQGSNGWHYWDGSSWVYNTSFDETEPTGSSSSVPESETLVPIGNNVIFNFGQRAFEYTPPTGAKYLRSSDLPAPDIADGSANFNTVLYTGTGTTNARTDVGFQPDLTWIKIRSAASNHAWYDAIRGSTKVIGSSATDAESTDGSVTPTSTGFTLGSENTSFGSTNGNGYTYVAWNWLAGNGTTTPTQGTIASTASVNQAAGFSIVSYTGTGSTGTVGHGLGVAPSMIIFKNRDDGGTYDYWSVYHSAYSPSSVLYLNTTDSVGYAGAFFDTAPTSTVFQVKTENKVNGTGDAHIAYCFAEVEGYSKFGSYTGNGATSANSGPFVYLGFKPSMVIIKRTDGSGGGWAIWDNKRNTYNIVDNYLFPNTSGSEADGNGSGWWNLDFLSNGFRVQSFNESNTNASGGNYIFAAFAENPFGGSGVSPATAR